LESGAGDCDDINGVLLPSLLGALGYATRLVTIAASPYSEDFSHVYCEVLVGGQWIPLDAARLGTSFASAPDFYNRARVWSLTDGSFEDVGGLGGYTNGMGDAASVWNAIFQSGANIARAATQPPLYTPAGAVYGYPYSAAAQSSTDYTPLIVIGAVVAILFLGNR
jgi:hypothetical protein